MINNMTIYLLITLILFLLLNPTLSDASNASNLMDGKFNAKSKKERTDVAKSILAKIESLKAFLPIMKPSEIAWLEDEEKAIEKLLTSNPEAALERLKKYDHSPEYQHRQLTLLINALQDDLNCIVNKNSTLKTEMMCWVSVSINLPNTGNFHDPLRILRQHGRLPEDVGKKAGLYISDNHIIAFDYYSRGILKHIVLSYMLGVIK